MTAVEHGTTAGLAEQVDALGDLAARDDLSLADLITVRESLELAKAAIPAALSALDHRIATIVNPPLVEGESVRKRTEYVPVVNHAGEHVTAKVGAGWSEKRGEYDDAALLRAVLDSRLFDPATGELIEETPVAKVLAVWAHAARDARTTVLDARHIDIRAFCERTLVPKVTIQR